jgi:integrase/recombinase XerD
MLGDDKLDHRHRERLQGFITASHLDQFTNWLVDLRYSQRTIRSYVHATARFATWASTNGYSELSALDQDCLISYRRHLTRTRGGGKRVHEHNNSYCAAGRFVRFLHHLGVCRARPTDVPPLVTRFSDWMRNQRGTSESTLVLYRRVICKLLTQSGREPHLYTAAQIRAFVLIESRGYSHSKAATATTAVRAFVRFLVAHQECSDGLRYAIPRLAKWGQASLPRYLEPEIVERVLDSCDVSTPLGSRDRAVLLLLARLGLRAGDVANLRLDDIDWPRGRIRVTGKSRQPEWLPLPQDVGDAILHYVKTARPLLHSGWTFLTYCAPYGPMLRQQVSAAAGRAIRRSGISAPSLGAHIFRHSAATAWLRQGLSLQSIGTLLRHRDVDTTAIYAKVDIGLLRQMAMPWPEEEHSPC